MKYYKAMVKLGHCGAGRSLDCPLFIKANNITDAMQKAQKTPAVKHKLIPEIMEISLEDYKQGVEQNVYIEKIRQIENKGLSK